ncbi:MAG: hypothetical protein A4S09_17580 [Proteobacteria bacterium SG_bin7]|nr:MAG: hypothetical protein A4S09_17580 [Proteobacteria bacterium SG_bin7]
MNLDIRNFAAFLFLLIVPQLVSADTLVNEDIDYNRYCVYHVLTEDTINCKIGWVEWGGSAGAPAAACTQTVELIDKYVNYYKKVDLKQLSTGQWGAGIFNFFIVGLVLDVPHQLMLRNEAISLALQKMKEANRHTCAAIGYVMK